MAGIASAVGRALHVVTAGLLPLVALLPPASAAPQLQGSTATLTIVGGRVEVQAPGAGGFAPGSDGQVVAVGGRVRTGPDGRAVLTFFDGSTATHDPDTEIALSRVQPSGGQGGLL